MTTAHPNVFEGGGGEDVEVIAVIFSDYLGKCLSCRSGEQSHYSPISGVLSGEREIIKGAWGLGVLKRHISLQ